MLPLASCYLRHSQLCWVGVRSLHILQFVLGQVWRRVIQRNSWPRTSDSGFAHSNSTTTGLLTGCSAWQELRQRLDSSQDFGSHLRLQPLDWYFEANQLTTPRQGNKSLILSTIIDKWLEGGPENFKWCAHSHSNQEFELNLSSWNYSNIFFWET